MNTRKKVVVLGGGYAGVHAANRLHTRAEVTLVNPRPEFVERIRLHQLAAGTGTATVAYDTLLGDGVELVVDRAEVIGDGKVELASGAVLDFDHLVYAVGSTGQGVAELEQAEALRDRLAAEPDAPVTVVGGGLTGIETAAELAEVGRTVTLLTGGTLAPSLGDKARRVIARTLTGLGVTIEDRRAADEPGIVVWTAGFGAPDLAARSGLRTDEHGRLLTDATLTSVDDERIVAAGDAASGEARMSCQAAGQLGAMAAATVLARLDGTTPPVAAPIFRASCLSLGRKAGLVQLAHTDDSPTRVVLAGRAGALVKEAVCKGTVWDARRAR